MVGLNTFSLFVPDEQVGVVVVTNRSEAGAFEFAEKLLGEVRGTPLWRGSVDEPLPFKTSYISPESESSSGFDGEYVHGAVTTRIEGIGGGVRVRRIRDGIEVHDDIATRVGPESFLSRSGAKIMQFPRGEDGRVEAYFAEGVVWSLLGD
jgi:hypothetical protein